MAYLPADDGRISNNKSKGWFVELSLCPSVRKYFLENIALESLRATMGGMSYSCPHSTDVETEALSARVSHAQGPTPGKGYPRMGTQLGLLLGPGPFMSPQQQQHLPDSLPATGSSWPPAVPPGCGLHPIGAGVWGRGGALRDPWTQASNNGLHREGSSLSILFHLPRRDLSQRRSPWDTSLWLVLNTPEPFLGALWGQASRLAPSRSSVHSCVLFVFIFPSLQRMTQIFLLRS